MKDNEDLVLPASVLIKQLEEILSEISIILSNPTSVPKASPTPKANKAPEKPKELCTDPSAESAACQSTLPLVRNSLKKQNSKVIPRESELKKNLLKA